MKRLPLLAGLLVLVALLFVASLAAGKVFVPLSAWFTEDPRWWIVAELRLPRAILGLVIGAGLGLTGAVLQGYLRNPLADPSVLGVSSSAALGAVAAIVLFAASAPITIFASAMIAAAGSMLLLVALAWRAQGAVTFVLAGTVLASLGGALTAFLISIAPNPYATAEIIDWIMGSLTDRSFAEVQLATPFILAGCAALLFTGRALDALTLGEEAARSLGLRLARTQALVVLGAGLAVGASVAVTGVVGFVGLIVPHLLRPLVGAKPSALLFPSALGGAALVLAADSLVRLAPGASEIRLGVAMALIGTPFFFVLLLKLRRSAWI